MTGRTVLGFEAMSTVFAPRPLRTAALTSFMVLATACSRDATPPATASGGPRAASNATPTTTVSPVVVRAYGAEELLAELERARGLLLVEKYQEAAAALDRLEVQAGDPALKASAAYHAGLAYDGMGERLAALERLERAASSYGDQAIARHALVKLTRLFGRLERWGDLGVAADRLLARTDMLVIDQLEALGAKALALVEQADVDRATVHVGKALALVERHGIGRSGQPPVQLAQIAFAEGEIRRLRSEAVTLVPITPDFGERLEARCQGLLDAQSAFTDAMRARDSFWSAMSGFRVGQLYTKLHAEAVTIPPPEKARTVKQKQLFEGALRLRYRILLEKGLKMMDATVRLGDRTGEDSEWVTRARESKRTLEQALADEKRALASLPYTEDELRSGLDALKGRSASDGKSKEPAGAKPTASTPAKP